MNNKYIPTITWIDDNAYVVGLYVGAVVYQGSNIDPSKQYRAWIMTCDDGDPLGYGTRDEAVKLVENKIYESFAND